ncbi:MAG: 4-hydroxy-tetrahydrodipicolinate reductase [Hyphomonadaceae bacterium]|nr:4-hydroxy-tetrahydrodipicolinate reductase [Hyphomonadaceae bacterium]
MTQTLSLGIAGVAGRMGRQLVSTALQAGHKIAGGTELPDSPDRETDIAVLAGRADPIGVLPCTDPVDAAAGAQVWVDFTAPQATLAALHALRHTPTSAVVIGTTGFTPLQESQIAAAGSEFAIVKAGNFSLGINLLTAMTRLVAARLGEDWDIEIAETHHRHKLDAPSGTALMLGDAAAKGRAGRLDQLRRAPYDGPDARRQAGEIGFAVRRAGGVVGDHEVGFASEQEVLSLGHRALDRAVFAQGALKAAEWAMTQPPGLYDMEDVLGLKGISV